MRATLANEQLVAGQAALLVTDVNDTDRLDRLLRYVWVSRSGPIAGRAHGRGHAIRASDDVAH